MAKQPYIPLYIGDWEQDTNCLSPLAEFALLKLTFKLFKSEKRGVFIANIRTLSVLFKSSLVETKTIFQELIDNNILNVSLIEEDKFEIISRRMIREATISEIRSESGGLGGRGNKANKKQNKSKQKAKAEQSADIDNDIIEIVKLLNECSGRNFKSETQSTSSIIKSRKKGGFIKEDFERVIRFKCSKWKDDPKMSEYLRPETLFGNKFEGYLQSCPKINVVTQGKTMTDEEYEEYVRPTKPREL